MFTVMLFTALRPGPSCRAGALNPANSDEALANPFPKLPPLLRLENGKRVKTRRDWERQRRPELVERFEREVIGRAGTVEASFGSRNAGSLLVAIRRKGPGHGHDAGGERGFTARRDCLAAA